MHSIKERPVVVNGQIVIRPIMVVALTYDHRLLDGREAVTFLGKSLRYNCSRNAIANALFLPFFSEGPRLLGGPSQDALGLNICLNYYQWLCRVYLIFERFRYALKHCLSHGIPSMCCCRRRKQSLDCSSVTEAHIRSLAAPHKHGRLKHN